MSTDRATLEDLRRKQGYFDQGLVMHETTMAEMLAQSGAGSVIVQDSKFNMSVVGQEAGGYIIVRQKDGTPIEVSPRELTSDERAARKARAERGQEMQNAAAEAERLVTERVQIDDVRTKLRQVVRAVRAAGHESLADLLNEASGPVRFGGKETRRLTREQIDAGYAALAAANATAALRTAATSVELGELGPQVHDLLSTLASLEGLAPATSAPAVATDPAVATESAATDPAVAAEPAANADVQQRIAEAQTVPQDQRTEEAARKDQMDAAWAQQSDAQDSALDQGPADSDRIRRQIDEKGHSGIEIHSHFLGNVEPTSIRRSMMESGQLHMVKGDPNGATASARVGDVTSWEPVLRAIAAYESKLGHKYQTDAAGNLVIDPQTNRPVIATRGISGDAMQQIREARARIEALKAELDSDDLTSVERERLKDKIYREARSAAEKALRASDETDFNSSYEIRDELVKQFYGRAERTELLAGHGLAADASWDQLVPVYREHFADRPAVLERIDRAVAAVERQDPGAKELLASTQKNLEQQFAYDAYAKQALLRLAQDNLAYTEQSNSANKLGQRFDEGQIDALKRQLIAEHPEMRAQIEGLEVKHVAMLNTNLFGARDPNVDQSDLHKLAKQRGSQDAFESAVDGIIQQTQRTDVVGVDIAGAEHFSLDELGQRRLEQLYGRLLGAAKGRGEPIVLRPHVGEGANDVVAGKHFGRDSDRQVVDGELSGAKRARDNLEAMIVSFERIAANFGGTLPPDVIVRFGHATMTTPDQAIRMAKLGIIAEVNLTSNDQTGASARNHTRAREGADGQRGTEQLPLHRPNPNQRNAPLEAHSLPTLIFNDVQTVLSTDAHSVMSTNMAAEYRTAKRLIDEVLAGRRPIPMTATQAHALGVEGNATLTGVNVFLDDIPAAQRAAVRQKFEDAYAQLYRDANAYYDNRPKQAGPATSEPGGRGPAGPIMNDPGAVSDVSSANVASAPSSEQAGTPQYARTQVEFSAEEQALIADQAQWNLEAYQHMKDRNVPDADSRAITPTTDPAEAKRMIEALMGQDVVDGHRVPPWFQYKQSAGELYRADNRPIDQVFAEGFQPRGTHRSVGLHVAGIAGQYVAFTKRMQFARDWHET